MALLYPPQLIQSPPGIADGPSGVFPPAVTVTKPRLVMGAFGGGDQMYQWLNGERATSWLDTGNPIATAEYVRQWLTKGRPFTGQSMTVPRPQNVRMAFAGYVPRLRDFTYAQAADNDPAWRQQWLEVGQALSSAGYGDTIIYSSETEKRWKPWMPAFEDMLGGPDCRWKRAWRNMVDAVRTNAPDVRFAFTPFSGQNAGPDNGFMSMEDWLVDGLDERGKPYMDYWGFTFYLGTHGTRCTYPGCTPTKPVFERALNFRRDIDRPWSLDQHLAFARRHGIKCFNSELGIMTDRGPDRPNAAGDAPEAIECIKSFLDEVEDDLVAAVWFNSDMPDGDSRLDGSNVDAMRSAVRVLELFAH